MAQFKKRMRVCYMLSHATRIPANSEALKSTIVPVASPDILRVNDGNSAFPPCAAATRVRHEALNLSIGERVRGTIHIQTVNSRHSRLKAFLGRATMAFHPNTCKVICDGLIVSSWRNLRLATAQHKHPPKRPEENQIDPRSCVFVR